jgi:hypothetical protein
MLWQTQTRRDIANLESEVCDLQAKYYRVSTDLARLLQYMNLVQVTTPEKTELLTKAQQTQRQEG